MALRDWLTSSPDAAQAATDPMKNSKGSVDNHLSDLPDRCPLLGGPVPPGCRFESRFFKRMVSGGTLPLPGGRCPFRDVCGLNH